MCSDDDYLTSQITKDSSEDEEFEFNVPSQIISSLLE